MRAEPGDEIVIDRAVEVHRLRRLDSIRWVTRCGRGSYSGRRAGPADDRLPRCPYCRSPR